MTALSSAELNPSRDVNLLLLGYEGTNFQGGTIKAESFIGVAAGLQDIVEIVTKTLYDDKFQAILYIDASEEGSFLQNFQIKLEMTGDQLNTIMTNHPKKVISVVTMGIIAAVLYGITTPGRLEQFRGMINDARETEQTERIIKRFERLAENKRIKKGVLNIARPHKGSSDANAALRLEFDNEQERIDAKTLQKAIKELSTLEEDEEEIKRNPISGAVVHIKKPDLTGGDKWDLIYKDQKGIEIKKSMQILDKEFLTFMKNETPSLDMYDVIYADIEEVTIHHTVKRDTSQWYVNKIHNITNVTTGGTVYPSSEPQKSE